jgi:uncharacterized protein YgiM (DUF1202 family)
MREGVKKIITTAMFLFCWAAPALAETAYVTDQLRLGIHAAPDTSDSAFASLLSGEKMEILQENIYYAQVKMEDGRIGWVKKTYLVKDPPAVRRVEDLQAERDELAGTVKRLQKEVIETRTRLKEIESEQTARSGNPVSGEAALRELRKENNALVQKLSGYRLSLPGAWAIGIAIAALVVGISFGWWFNDYRSRQRHGGFRI